MTHALQIRKRKHWPKRKRTNIYTFWWIKSEKKTTLPFLRNQVWSRVRFETEKVNDLLTNIQTNGITELKKINIRRSTDRKLKPGSGPRFKSQIRRLPQAKILKRNIKKLLDETEKARQLELKKSLGRPTKNTLKEGKIKRYWARRTNTD